MRIVWALVLIVIACGFGNGSENSLGTQPGAETLDQLVIQEGESHSGKWNRLAHSWQLIPGEREFRMFQAAAWRDDADIITELAVGGRLFLDARDAKGYAPLHYAAIYNARKVIAELILQGANLEVTDNHDSTPLHTAVHSFSRGAAAELIMRGANVHATDKYGRTPMYYATLLKECTFVADMLACGTHIDPKSEIVKTPSFHEVWKCVEAIEAQQAEN